ncbi:MAG: hypothetical protein JSV99_04160 [Planctomycetota bacterium]|nr:MAG: hypothetical protein JSV99_04160 [Planctomycetota bacterium]
MMAEATLRLAENFIKKKPKFLLAKVFAARQNGIVRYLGIVSGVDGC